MALVKWLLARGGKATQNRDHHAMNVEVLLLNIDRLVAGVLCNKLHAAPANPQTLDRGFAGQSGHNDIAVRRGPLLTYYDSVTIQNSGVAHAVTAHAESKETPSPEPTGRDWNVSLLGLRGFLRDPGDDSPKEWNPGDGYWGNHQAHLPSAPSAKCDVALSRQGTKVVTSSAGRSPAELSAEISVRRCRLALFCALSNRREKPCLR